MPHFCEVPYCIFRTFLLLYSHRKRITLSLPEAIPPHHSLIVHSIMTRKESKVIVMIALGSLFFWRQRDQENPFGLHFFIFWVLWSFRIPPLRQRSDGQDWADKWARIEGDNIRAEAIPPHLSLIVHSIMTRKESKVIVMIALGSLFLWRLKIESRQFNLIGVFAGNLSKFSY